MNTEIYRLKGKKMAKNRFYLYTEYRAYLDGMTDEDQAQLFRTILDYESGEELEELSPAVRAVFSFIKNRLDNNRKEYEKTCEARAEAGQKGGEAKASKTKQNVANGSKPKQNVANAKFSRSDNDNDKDNDKEKENKKHIYGEYGHVRLTDAEHERLISDYGEAAVQDGIKNVDEYCQEHGKTYKDYNLTLRKWGIKTGKIEKPKGIPPDRNAGLQKSVDMPEDAPEDSEEWKRYVEDCDTHRYEDGWRINDDGYWINTNGNI